MFKCKSCGMPLGSNKDCEECLKYLSDRGTEEIDEEGAKRAGSDARDWLGKRGKSAPEKLFNLVKLTAEMIQDYFSEKYNKVPWTAIAASAFAILYIVNPFDLIPDFIPGIGWLDDITVVNLVLLSIVNDLKEYCIFKRYPPENYGLA